MELTQDEQVIDVAGRIAAISLVLRDFIGSSLAQDEDPHSALARYERSLIDQLRRPPVLGTTMDADYAGRVEATTEVHVRGFLQDVAEVIDRSAKRLR